jgi:hypothetical protein
MVLHNLNCFKPTFLPTGNEIRLMRSPSCLCVYQLFNPSENFYVILYGSHAIQGDLNAIIFNPVASTIPKWQPLKFLTWMQNLHQSTHEHEILYADRSSKEDNFFFGAFEYGDGVKL